MECRVFTLILLTLLGSHAVPVTQPFESFVTKDKPVNTVNVTTKNNSDNTKGLQTDCEELCQLCNATARLEQDGSCTCLSDNGGEVECAHFPRYKKELKHSLEEGKDTERKQRCLGILGSSKDTISAPANSLQSILGDGLLSMSPVERAEEFRKRVDALRAITVTNIQKALEQGSAVKTEPLSVPVLKLPTLPNTLPLSPFVGIHAEEKVLGKSIEDDTLFVKKDEIIQLPKPVNEPKIEVAPKASVSFDIPDFTLRSQIPSVRPGSSIYTPSRRINLRIPQMTANFLPQQLRLQPQSFGGFGNYRREGRTLRSSGPFVLVQSPIIPNPSNVYDIFQSSSTDTIPIIAKENLSSETNPQDLFESKSAVSQDSSSTLTPADITHSVYNVTKEHLSSETNPQDLSESKSAASQDSSSVLAPADNAHSVYNVTKEHLSSETNPQDLSEFKSAASQDSSSALAPADNAHSVYNIAKEHLSSEANPQALSEFKSAASQDSSSALTPSDNAHSVYNIAKEHLSSETNPQALSEFKSAASQDSSSALTPADNAHSVYNIAKEHLSSEANPQALSEIKSAASQVGSSTNSQFNASDFTHSVYKVANGDLSGIGKLVESDKGIGSKIQGLVGTPKEDKVTVEDTPSTNSRVFTDSIRQ